MKRAAVALACVALNAAAADFAVGVNAISLHSQSGYESITPGLYVRGAGPAFGELGVLRNSIGFTTVHAGIGYVHTMGRFDAGLSVGVSYGYRDRQEWFYPDGSAPNFYTYGPPKFRPMIAPSVGYRIDDEWGARLFVLPAIKGKTETWCLSFAIERFF